MFKKLTPLLLICLTAGLIVSCSSSDPLISEAESGIENQNYDATITAAEKYIQQNPQSPLGYYYKGVALGSQGQAHESPQEANSYFKEMKASFEKAKELASGMEEQPDQLSRIDAIEKSIWRTEHNTAVNYASDDSLMQATENPYQISLAHLSNALLVQPDDTLSLGVFAQVNGMQGNYGEAAKAQQKYIELKDSTDAKTHLLLAQYYRNSDQPEQAIATLEKAQQRYPENVQLIEILADSYSQAGEAKKAIAMVEDLVEQNPSEPRYRLSLGTQIYQSALEMQTNYDENIDAILSQQQNLRGASGDEQQQIQSKIDKLKAENKNLLQEINAKTDQAVENLNAVVENDPQNTSAYNTLGIIYQNKAAVYFDQRNIELENNQRAAELDKLAKEQLKKAMTNYEQAAELAPENTKYWKSLYQVYVALGMDEKAAEAEKKAGLQ